MKIKSLTLLLALSFLANISFAQYAGSYKLTKSNYVSVKHKKANYQKPKFYIMPEIGAGLILDDSDLEYDATLEFGCEFNKFFSLGIGAGYISVTNSYDPPFISPEMSSIPLYLNMHGSFSKKNVSPYWSIGLGINIPIENYGRYQYLSSCWKGEDCYASYYYEISGLMISPELGLRLGSCSYLGIKALMMGINESRYEEHVYPCYYSDRWSSNWEPEWALSLKFGYKIMSHK